MPAAAPIDTRGTTRRSFHIGAIYGLWGLIAAALGLPTLAYLFLPPKARRQDEWADAGDISKLAFGAPVELAFRRNRVDGWKIYSEKSTAWVVKRAGNVVTAFGPQCTHLGCAYHWEDAKGQFLCPCHSSLFSADGAVVAGPAPRPLDRYETRVENGRLLIGPLRKSEGA